MKNFILASCLLLFSLNGSSQVEFFRSTQAFSKEQLADFYSSVTIVGDLVLFNANDYFLYAYDRESGILKWKTNTHYKTNISPFFVGNSLYAGVYLDKHQLAAEFDIDNGRLIRQLPVGPLATKPIKYNDLLIGTALYDGGGLFAYDTKKDSITWWRFLAHGFSRQPYFDKSRILANAEADNWVEVNYNGQLTDTTCAKRSSIFVNDIPCVKNFVARTHDGTEINRKLAKSLFGDQEMELESIEMITGSRTSYVLWEDKLHIIGDRGKLKRSIDLTTLTDSIDIERSGLTRLLQADDQRVLFVYNDQLLEYDQTKKKLVRRIDLSSWKPHSIIVNGVTVWLISGANGLLYGLTI